MTRTSDRNREEKKELILELVKRRSGGITTSEIATTLNIPDRSVRDYVRELEEEHRISKDGNEYVPMPIDLQRPLIIKPNPVEAVMLYLALRMLVKQSDRRNHLAENLLLKLAGLANKELHLGKDLEDVAREMAYRPDDPNHKNIFEKVMTAYLFRNRLRIRYHPYKAEPFETLFDPYLIEPSGTGYGMYMIGYSHLARAIRSYKIERIQEAETKRESFEVPKDFPGIQILRSAWSIYYGDTHEHVVLRFAPEVARRVRESNWRGLNPNLEDDPNQRGYVRYSFDIADTTDLLPWIRTWGANVEVLEPAHLRDTMIGEARALATLYGWNTSTTADLSNEQYDDIFEG
ncbi:MAG: helix-turn-helix transcriptional regulator [Phototrophicaceae bacterium]